MSEFKYRNVRTKTEYMNLGRALDEADDQNDVEVIRKGGEEDE